MQRFGRRDQDVRAACGPSRPARGPACRRSGRRPAARAAATRSPRDLARIPLEGKLQVAPDVLIEGLERRDVEDPDALLVREAFARDGRARPETRRASCPSRSARRSACSAPTRWPASRAAARASARRTARGTTTKPPDETGPERRRRDHPGRLSLHRYSRGKHTWAIKSMAQFSRDHRLLASQFLYKSLFGTATAAAGGGS